MNQPGGDVQSALKMLTPFFLPVFKGQQEVPGLQHLQVHIIFVLSRVFLLLSMY
jgi:hypothetical protein